MSCSIYSKTVYPDYRSPCMSEGLDLTWSAMISISIVNCTTLLSVHSGRSRVTQRLRCVLFILEAYRPDILEIICHSRLFLASHGHGHSHGIRFYNTNGYAYDFFP
jgi:hypothetical protein